MLLLDVDGEPAHNGVQTVMKANAVAAPIVSIRLRSLCRDMGCACALWCAVAADETPFS